MKMAHLHLAGCLQMTSVRPSVRPQNISPFGICVLCFSADVSRGRSLLRNCRAICKNGMRGHLISSRTVWANLPFPLCAESTYAWSVRPTVSFSPSFFPSSPCNLIANPVLLCIQRDWRAASWHLWGNATPSQKGLSAVNLLESG